MKFKHCVLMLLVSGFCYSQNFDQVDSTVKKYGSFSKIEDLVSKINSDFVSSVDKTRAVFFWICQNISYDVAFSDKITAENLQAFSYKTEAEFIQKEKKFNSDLALTTFQSGKAVCYGYSALFNDIENKLGIECKLIRGNLKSDPSQIGNPVTTNHGWNAVKINGDWKLVDCTLAAGRISSKTQQFVFDFRQEYFFLNPELFVLNHFPDDEKWLLGVKKTKSEYSNLPVYFTDFFRYNEKITLPSIGQITEKADFQIKFSAFNFEEDYLAYKFSGETQKTSVDLESKLLQFPISLTNKNNQLLYIYLNNKPIAVYSIRN